MAPLMARAAGVAGRMGANVVRLVRRGVGHFAVPRGPIWIRIRLAPPIEDLLPPPFFRARDHSLSFLELLQVLDHCDAGSPGFSPCAAPSSRCALRASRW
jgi:hypothetical protein